MCAATYLDDAGDDAAGGVAIADDGTIWYAGSRSGDDLGATPTAIMGRGDGVVLHPSGDGRALLSITRIGSHVDDVAVIPGGDAIAVVGDFGVAVLEDGATTLAWSAQTSGDASSVPRRRTGAWRWCTTSHWRCSTLQAHSWPMRRWAARRSTTSSCTGNGETAVSLAAGANVAVAFHQSLDDATTSEQPMLTFDAIQASAGGGAADGWLAVFPAP